MAEWDENKKDRLNCAAWGAEAYPSFIRSDKSRDNAITVGELIDHLQQFEKDRKIYTDDMGAIRGLTLEDVEPDEVFEGEKILWIR